MLRGSSRHDGIPNKQSARERDRDRLRERQRQERQQMLPNDEKDINVGAQDLFHAPVKVKPSVDDSTSAQIANTLGSFDTVRHLILDTSSRRLVNLIGVDQGSVPGTPIATRPSPAPLIPGFGHSPAEIQSIISGTNKSSSYSHSSSQLSTGQQQSNSSESSLTTGNSKGHHRTLYSSSSSSGSNSTAGGGNNSLTNSEFTFPPSSAAPSGNNFRSTSSGNHLQKGIPHSQSSSHTSNSSSGHSANANSSHAPAAVGGSGNHGSSSVSNSGSNNHTTNSHGNSASNSNQVRQTALSFNNSNNSNNNSSSNNNGSSAPPGAVTDVSSEGFSSANKTVSNALLFNNKESLESVSGADDKNPRHASSNKKPALERADSQLEIESMLKEMMDVTAPLTAIQTPVKETATKKFTQRRSSKSEEKIVQSIRDSGMADVPSPVQRMDSSGDSSSSYESETSDSESEDSSSGSQAGGDKLDVALPKIPPSTNSPTRWNLGAFMGPRKNDYRADTNTTTIGGAKSPKDTNNTKPNAHQVNAINSETSPGDAPVKTDSIVSSTSLYNKSQSLSPLDTPPAPPITRKSTRNIVEAKSEPYVPPKPPPSASAAKSTNSTSTNNPVNKSLSGSSSEDDGAKAKKEANNRASTPAGGGGDHEKTASLVAAGGKRKRKRSSSSAERNVTQPAKGGIVDEPPPENSAVAAAATAAAAAANAANANNKKGKNNNVQDRNKNDTIRRLFMFKKVDSPTRGDSSELGKSPTSGTPNANGNGSSSSANASMSGSGSNTSGNSGSSSGVHERGSGGSSSSNRVQAKDSGRKGKTDNSAVSNNVHNGEINASATSAGATKATETASKKGKSPAGGGSKEKESSSSSSSSSRSTHGKKNQKSVPPIPGSSSSSAKSSSSSSSSASITNASLLLPPPPPPAAKVKDVDIHQTSSKADKSIAMLSSSLVVKIHLNKLKRKPNTMPAPPPPPPLLPPPPLVKVEKDNATDVKGAKTIKEPQGTSSNNADLFQKRVHHNSSRVGSSSDHTKDAKETAVVAHNPPPARAPPDVPSLCSDKDFRGGKKRSKSKKVKSSPKKTKTKHEPDSHSKVLISPHSKKMVEEDTVCGEVSSNVLGYASCDSVSVTTTRTPPVESDVVQAPDSSLNPPHLPSPVVPPQPIYYSYFEKSDHLEDYCTRDQDSYLEEAKRLKHKADGERVSTTQASVYLEAGLYFILTGISMERDRTVGSTAAYTMYKDTLVLIRYIGSRFRNRGADFSNPMEAKIIVLSMRCQSMLSYKLFKIKMRETKEMVQYLQEHFQRHPTLDLPPVINSPQLSTPSPHSPTSSPAASSSLHPSPHHHPTQIMTSIPRNVYANMQKTCGSAMNLISAHEMWDAADTLVEKYHLEDFFIQLDRQMGPITLHHSLVDLVRYVKHALQILKTSELS